ncbi:hypothetical protein E1B28_004232 [Marasmius oreades]|uniref:Uncharacterized protein n=1 Tax=Marasmius oreades TaxID=181124 RepID=A0A9P8ACV5_9AGAR|nr:uncharacterized protein E1B28_004232 [Marasmius oreades]KAG7096823.1 hypothetical protein E1B28_004232 [Marasmius oreades]
MNPFLSQLEYPSNHGTIDLSQVRVECTGQEFHELLEKVVHYTKNHTMAHWYNPSDLQCYLQVNPGTLHPDSPHLSFIHKRQCPEYSRNPMFPSLNTTLLSCHWEAELSDFHPPALKDVPVYYTRENVPAQSVTFGAAILGPAGEFDRAILIRPVYEWVHDVFVLAQTNLSRRVVYIRLQSHMLVPQWPSIFSTHSQFLSQITPVITGPCNATTQAVMEVVGYQYGAPVAFNSNQRKDVDEVTEEPAFLEPHDIPALKGMNDLGDWLIDHSTSLHPVTFPLADDSDSGELVFASAVELSPFQNRLERIGRYPQFDFTLSSGSTDQTEMLTVWEFLAEINAADNPRPPTSPSVNRNSPSNSAPGREDDLRKEKSDNN